MLITQVAKKMVSGKLIANLVSKDPNFTFADLKGNELTFRHFLEITLKIH